MRCADCGRALLKPALEIPTKNGPLAFGPVCARRYIVRPTRTLFPVLERRARPVAVDERQLVLELAC